MAAPLLARAALAQEEPAVARAMRQLLAHLVQDGREAVGMIAGLVGGAQRMVVAHGRTRLPDGPTPDADTLFEIGSITKTFTSLLLADAVERGEVAMEDPVARLLPADWRVPEHDGRPITLLDLATHTSGLPRMPANFAPADPQNPYADYRLADLRDAIAVQPLLAGPGSRYLYSNLGLGLLGQALAFRLGRPWAELVAERICRTLGMAATQAVPAQDQAGRQAAGHSALLRPVPPWRFDALAPAGALWSSVGDMMTFLAAVQARPAGALGPAFARMLALRRPIAGASHAAAGWFTLALEQDELAWTEGATGGFASFAGVSLRSGRGVVVLANAASWAAVPVLGRHVLNPALPAPPVRRVVALVPAQLDRLVGRYALSRGFQLTVTRQDDQLMVQATGQPAIEVYPEGPTRFFYRAVEAWLEFDLPEDGPATALTLHQAGRSLRAGRVE